MTTEIKQEYVYLRSNTGDHPDSPPYRMNEKECRRLIAATMKNVDAAIRKLQRGKQIVTKFAIYRAEKI